LATSIPEEIGPEPPDPWSPRLYATGRTPLAYRFYEKGIPNAPCTPHFYLPQLREDHIKKIIWLLVRFSVDFVKLLPHLPLLVKRASGTKTREKAKVTEREERLDRLRNPQNYGPSKGD